MIMPFYFEPDDYARLCLVDLVLYVAIQREPV